MDEYLRRGAQRKQILSLGELLVDLIPGKEQMTIDEPGPVIKTASGSAGIFACAVSLLDGRGGFIGKIGKDSLSRMVTRTLKEQGVDLSHVVESDEGQIGLGFIEYLPSGRNYQYYRKRSVGSLLRAEELDENYIAGAYAVHFPGMLLELSEEMRGACQRLVELAHQYHLLVSFDPNIRSELSVDSNALGRMLWATQNADIISPTLSEAQMLTGEKDIDAVLDALHAMGPRVVALTRDKDGLVLSTDGQVAYADGINRQPLDPTGAGDTLAAALCVGLQEGMPLERLAAFCNSAGTLVITKRGAIGMALPTREEVDQLVNSGECRVNVLRRAKREGND